MNELYEHTKYWENKFNNVWGGHDNTYAGWVHGQAKEAYFSAMIALRKLGMEITSMSTNMVPIFQNLHGRPDAGNSYELEVNIKSGYARETKLDAELHTKFYAEVKASGKAFAADVEGTVGSEVSASIRASSTVSNTAEKSEKVSIKLNLSKPVYVYQISFSAVMADGTTIKGWGAGYVVSELPIA